ncbi:MAG: hypothetical protein HOB40_04075 [Candidatus Marinimicrobia bacterium]|jgi:hypothetical protein|nr:hypothetical protein [Candidatus Neomarinimicrobiota bacterium]MBT3500723.1 hypothetical protein [Candidatus Neomarinimicrobiota bacterium]MBT3839571.1 hypothetical protein [Candidatus Neomarinimicrobiota bacterium]MBT3999439.1 hypothetical protein [Candidatus Neomarinimicrobiota bacterium]MBT4283160.1 hypothetical protein [Candidatus Neomarinimicrobiota bacterium]
MICPECHAEYLDHIIECGDCKVSLINASAVDMPLTKMTWAALPPFQGKIYADMAAEILEKNNIPYYLKMDWTASAFSIESATIPGEVVRIFVPKDTLEKASDLVSSISGDSE